MAGVVGPHHAAADVGHGGHRPGLAHRQVGVVVGLVVRLGPGGLAVGGVRVAAAPQEDGRDDLVAQCQIREHPGRRHVDRGQVLAALAAPDEEQLPPDALDLAEARAGHRLRHRRVVRIHGRTRGRDEHVGEADRARDHVVVRVALLGVVEVAVPELAELVVRQVGPQLLTPAVLEALVGVRRRDFAGRRDVGRDAGAGAECVKREVGARVEHGHDRLLRRVGVVRVVGPALDGADRRVRAVAVGVAQPETGPDQGTGEDRLPVGLEQEIAVVARSVAVQLVLGLPRGALRQLLLGRAHHGRCRERGLGQDLGAGHVDDVAFDIRRGVREHALRVAR